MESRKLWVFTDKEIIEIVTFLKISHIDCTELYFTVWIETMDRNNTLIDEVEKLSSPFLRAAQAMQLVRIVLMTFLIQLC